MIRQQVIIIAFCLGIFGISSLLLFGQETNLRDVYATRFWTIENESSFTAEWSEASWMKLKPRKTLKWIDCYVGRQCARLIVPLNYSEPDGATAIIALTRKPAQVPSDSPDYKGPILINPGGPGGSGVSTVVSGGDRMALILGPNFDIVGFDPRGVGRSLPQAAFFKTPAERALFRADSSTALEIGVSRIWAYAQLAGQLAKDTDDGYLVHINTDQTARDMLAIVHAHGHNKLQYWGFSYGSVLGLTFAAMFPDKVGRIIVDGVVDVEDYYATLWSQNLWDTDKGLDTFFTGCVAAGPENCAFFAETPEEIASNLDSLYKSVRAKPRAVHTSQSNGLLDYIGLRAAVFTALYSPYASFPTLAQGLADLAAGNPQTIYGLTAAIPFDCSSPNILPTDSLEAQTAILCNDGQDVSESLEEAQKYYDAQRNISQWAELWSRIHISCSGWPRLPKTHFKGPFVGNTSHPILLIGNTADPVTPLRGAIKMSKGYTGAVVLTQNSAGHCSMSAPSVCTAAYIKGYFEDGTLPEPGTTCPVVGSPFPGPMGVSLPDSQVPFHKELDAHNRSILEAAEELSRIYPLFAPWKMNM